MSRRLTPDRFLSLWTAAGGDEVPFPLRYRSTAAWENEYVADLRAAGEWRRRLDDPALEHAVRTLHMGEISIEVYGSSCHPGESVFASGAILGESAVLARQYENAGDIEVAWMPADLLAAAVAGFLPVVRPGRMSRQTAPARDILDPVDRDAVRLPQGGSAAHAIRGLLLRERTATGSVRFFLGAPGTASRAVSGVGWFDVVDDGRYLFAEGTDTRVTPGTTDVLREEVSSQLNAARSARRASTGQPRRRIDGLSAAIHER
ncbi:ESX secretion-associated protein EspG [Rhodococcus coprophilus]|uniref:ESX secretion-associated protein EspG n=1 Tax=Rhodococcus coprophilus TaxID=38310 RepID=A0A2X4U6W5_9NOCA|nr:ESX secretion-associated protein EspG [Rhodococcus coprophilus]MBM7459100.1 hypothetical protein [Rhodococcus coprophilus]SQI34721.1 Uncharacterised protein [Rhodococcus coprophilus]